MALQTSTQEMEIQSTEKPISEKMKRLVEIAERDSLRRDFEIVREMHNRPSKESTFSGDEVCS